MEYIISDLSDEELCMLEQLAFLDEDVAITAGITKWDYDDNCLVFGFKKINNDHLNKTISSILSVFDDEAIDNLRTHSESICDAAITGVEWANLISYLKDPNNRISNLRLKSIMDTGNTWHSEKVFYSQYVIETGNYPLALTFTFDGDEDNAIVAFKGTTGPEEWADNINSCRVSDTDPQIAALDYIESLDYDNIIVTGHSKGSNKAMYVTILSDKVSKCVGFDGQGFSDLFLAKYRDRIVERAWRVTNYSLAGDFVHIMMNQLTGSNQKYCKGYYVDSFPENHSPVSFF